MPAERLRVTLGEEPGEPAGLAGQAVPVGGADPAERGDLDLAVDRSPDPGDEPVDEERRQDVAVRPDDGRAQIRRERPRAVVVGV